MTAQAAAVPRSVIGSTLPFALPIGLSAFLLFSVEPLVGRLVLPVFGGTPAVWATVLFFFQAVLLAGYLYGHVSVTRLGRLGPAVHLVLVAGLAFLVAADRPGSGSPTSGSRRSPRSWTCCDPGRLIVLLPAFVLTTTTPLVSGWFAPHDR